VGYELARRFLGIGPGFWTFVAGDRGCYLASLGLRAGPYEYAVHDVDVGDFTYSDEKPKVHGRCPFEDPEEGGVWSKKIPVVRAAKWFGFARQVNT
jgi:hypothetical protein